MTFIEMILILGILLSAIVLYGYFARLIYLTVVELVAYFIKDVKNKL